MDKIHELLTRGVANIIPSREELEKKLRSNSKLNIYFGIDPTAPKIHIGHAVSIRKLSKFIDLGHNVTFLIGSFTSLVGDTSDKNSERPILTAEEIEANFQTYKQQAEKILDFSKIKIVRNGDWLKNLTLADIIKLTQQFSVNDFISRELIRNRLAEGKRVRLDEVLYPIMQGYDSYTLDTDVQLGGTDQTFNMQAGRTIIKNIRKKESFVLTTPFLTGTDGRKMSKSWNNAIWLEENANDMYAKVMAVNDDLLIEYFTLATDVPLSEIAEIEQAIKQGEHPMTVKKRLAHEIVSELHTKQAAADAAKAFESRVQKKELPTAIETVKIATNEPIKFEDLVFQTGLTTSKSDAKRVIEQGGVELNGTKKTNPNEIVTMEQGMILKVGKRKVVQLEI